MIIASAAYLSVEVIATANAQAAIDGTIAAIFAFLSALLALSLMMRLLRSVSFTPYVIYRVLLARACCGGPIAEEAEPRCPAP